MGWGKIGSVCSLKAIALACFLTPTTATILPTTPAYAQFNIIIPGFNSGYHGRRYGRSRYSRRSRRGGRGGGEAGEVSAQPSAPPSSVGGAPAPSAGSGSAKKIRGTSD
jgi:hypothetical protein